MTKIVCTSDTHFPFDAAMFPSGDMLIHAGDLMYTGLPSEWYPRIASLAAVSSEYKHSLFVPGNHDYHVQNYEGVAVSELRKQAGFQTLGLSRPIRKVGGINILGIPWVPNLRGWAFCRSEEWIYDWLNAVTEGEHIDLVVSHAPVHGILDAIHPEHTRPRDRKQVGSFGMRRWINERAQKPTAWVCGHIHESYGRENFDGVEFLNVAMCDKEYKQTNLPMVIEL